MKILRFIGQTKQCEEAVHDLVKLHPEIQEVNIGSSFGLRNSISNISVSWLLTLPDLTSLNLWYPVISGDGGLNSVSAQYLQLTSLELKHCKLTDDGLCLLLEKCVSLERLDVRGTQVSGEMLSTAKASPPIEDLNLSKCPRLTDFGLKTLLNITGSTLKALNIGETNVTLEKLLRIKIPLGIEKLQCCHCKNLSDEGLTQIFLKLGSSLHHLDLKLTPISGESLGYINASISKLKNISCFGSNLTDTGLRHLVRLCGASLRSLNVGYTRVSVEVPFPKSSLPLLENLNCFGCGPLSP